MRLSTSLGRALAVAALALCAWGASPASAKGTREAARDELAQAFRVCEDAMQPDTPAARRVALLAEYRAARARAVKLDATVLTGNLAVGDYSVREWLPQCDEELPKLVSKRDAAQAEALEALAQCNAVPEAGALEDAESAYKAFRAKRRAAVKLDARVLARSVGGRALGAELAACDKRATRWLAAERARPAGDEDRDDVRRLLRAAQAEQDNALGGTSPHPLVAAAARRAPRP